MSRAALVLALLVGCQPAAGDNRSSESAGSRGPRSRSTPEARGPTGPIVVELFTSQGCSSCPPADRVVSELARRGEVIALAFHVDYWNDLGWADPFSRSAWTDRQRGYAASLDRGRIYTPQLVVGGSAHVVGSRRTDVTGAIDRAIRPARIEAAIEWTDRVAIVTATAPAGGDAWIAIYEDGLVTPVPRGENAGEKLRNDRIVRVLERVATAGRRGRVEIALDPAWKRLGAVAIAQARDMTIVGSRALPAR